MAEFEVRRVRKLVPALTGELVRVTRLERKNVKKERKPRKKRPITVVWEKDGNTVIPKIGGQIAQPEVEKDWIQR